MDAWQLGTVLRGTLISFFWFAIIWMFVATFADILRGDLSGWAKGGWALLIVALPFLGILLYLIARPPPASTDPWLRHDTPAPHPGWASPVDQISKASALYESGKISSTEFRDIKRRVLA